MQANAIRVEASKKQHREKEDKKLQKLTRAYKSSISKRYCLRRILKRNSTSVEYTERIIDCCCVCYLL